jgi:hypothetical protein
VDQCIIFYQLCYWCPWIGFTRELAMEIELKMPWVQGVTAILISRRNSKGYGNYRLLVSWISRRGCHGRVHGQCYGQFNKQGRCRQVLTWPTEVTLCSTKRAVEHKRWGH